MIKGVAHYVRGTFSRPEILQRQLLGKGSRLQVLGIRSNKHFRTILRLVFFGNRGVNL